MLELGHVQSVDTFLEGPVLLLRLLALPRICSGLAEPAVTAEVLLPPRGRRRAAWPGELRAFRTWWLHSGSISVLHNPHILWSAQNESSSETAMVALSACLRSTILHGMAGRANEYKWMELKISQLSDARLPRNTKMLLWVKVFLFFVFPCHLQLKK